MTPIFGGIIAAGATFPARIITALAISLSRTAIVQCMSGGAPRRNSGSSTSLTGAGIRLTRWAGGFAMARGAGIGSNSVNFDYEELYHVRYWRIAGCGHPPWWEVKLSKRFAKVAADPLSS